MVSVGVLGATGYAGYELVKIIHRHPQAELAFLSSQSYAGQSFATVYPCPYDIKLVAPDDAPLDQADVVGPSASISPQTFACTTPTSMPSGTQSIPCQNYCPKPFMA